MAHNKLALFCAVILMIGGVFGQNPTTPSTTTAGTTASPTTSTAQPTTSAAPNTTTVAPASTTVAPSSDALPETRPSSVKEERYILNSTQDHACLVANFGALVAFQYNDAGKQVTRYLEITNGTVDEKNSKCGSEEEILKINSEPQRVILTLTIAKNENQSEIFVSDLLLEAFVNSSLLPHYPDANKTAKFETRNQKLWAVPESSYYNCHDDQNAELTGDKANVTLILTNLKLEAFRNSTSSDFIKTVHDCKANSNDIVPIAVGCALAALVVIVLIAYFVGRNRSRRSNYQSV